VQLEHRRLAPERARDARHSRALRKDRRSQRFGADLAIIDAAEPRAIVE
jgi:hypothetical protein